MELRRHCLVAAHLRIDRERLQTLLRTFRDRRKDARRQEQAMSLVASPAYHRKDLAALDDLVRARPYLRSAAARVQAYSVSVGLCLQG